MLIIEIESRYVIVLSWNHPPENHKWPSLQRSLGHGSASSPASYRSVNVQICLWQNNTKRRGKSETLPLNSEAKSLTSIFHENSFVLSTDKWGVQPISFTYFLLSFSGPVSGVLTWDRVCVCGWGRRKPVRPWRTWSCWWWRHPGSPHTGSGTTAAEPSRPPSRSSEPDWSVWRAQQCLWKRSQSSLLSSLLSVQQVKL